MLKKLAVLFVVMATTSVSAQTNSTLVSKQLGQPSASPLATTTCQSTFTSGSGLTYISFCVTRNGNVLYFTAPQGFLQQHPSEGYSLCDFAGNINYTDEANYTRGTWLTSTVSQPL